MERYETLSEIIADRDRLRPQVEALKAENERLRSVIDTAADWANDICASDFYEFLKDALREDVE